MTTEPTVIELKNDNFNVSEVLGILTRFRIQEELSIRLPVLAEMLATANNAINQVEVAVRLFDPEEPVKVEELLSLLGQMYKDCTEEGCDRDSCRWHNQIIESLISRFEDIKYHYLSYDPTTNKLVNTNYETATRTFNHNQD